MSCLKVLVVCLQAFLIQSALGQLASRSGYTGLEVEVDAVSRGAAGLSGYGLGSGLGSAGINNIGLNGIGFGNAGLGLSSIGNVGLGLNNAGYGSGFGLGVPDVTAVAASLPVSGPYGGTGYAELSVGGDVGATGSAVVTGQVPILGAVSFNGGIPASGVVSIAGNCGCARVPL